MNHNLPKVLILSRGVWDDSKGTSSTLTNLFEDYDPDKLGDLAAQTIQQPLPTKLNKLKKTHPEAFFYWNEIQSIL